jgi:PII-like signaling protein
MNMEHRFKGERTLMRIFIGESDKAAHGPHRGHPLYHALVELLRERNFAGATVLRGIEGFGASAKLHTANLLDLSLDLPIVVEVIETEERIQEVLPDLDEMIGGGLITLEKVRVILYRPANVPEGERWKRRIEGLEPGGDTDARAG